MSIDINYNKNGIYNKLRKEKVIQIFYLFYRYSNFIFQIFLFLYISIINSTSISEISLVIIEDGFQYILNENYYKEPDEVIVNGESRNDCSKFCEFTSKPNNVIIRFNDEITTCENMFNGINNMTQIDLSNFHSEQVTKMSYMFNECSNLINIKFGNFKTSSTIDMECLFK